MEIPNRRRARAVPARAPSNQDPLGKQIDHVHRPVRWQRQSADQLSFDFGPQPPLLQAMGEAPCGTVAEPLLFPLARRHSLVRKLAEQFARASSRGLAEKLLRVRLARLARGLRRKRLSEETIKG